MGNFLSDALQSTLKQNNLKELIKPFSLFSRTVTSIKLHLVPIVWKYVWKWIIPQQYVYVWHLMRLIRKQAIVNLPSLHQVGICTKYKSSSLSSSSSSSSSFYILLFPTELDGLWVSPTLFCCKQSLPWYSSFSYPPPHIASKSFLVFPSVSLPPLPSLMLF